MVRDDAAWRRVIVELSDGWRFAFVAKLGRGLEGAGVGDLGRDVIEGNGYGLHWTTLDADLAIPDLMAGLLST